MTINKKPSQTEVLEQIIIIVCYISLPLIFLFATTMLFSFWFSGNININVNESDNFYQVLFFFSFPMLISLVVIPLLTQIKIQHNTFQNLGFIKKPKKYSLFFCIMLFMIVVVCTYLIHVRLITRLSVYTICFHFLIVAISEEIILRSIIMHELKKIISSKYILCLINAILFSFIYHSSADFLSNLLIRLPLGFVLSFSRIESNDIYLPIMIHWAYNMGVTVIG